MRARLMKEGRCDRVWLLGQRLQSGKRVTREWLKQDVRRGDVIVVTDPRMVMTDGNGSPRRRLFAGLRWCDGMGATVEVLGGKMHTRSQDARDLLIEAALDAVARASRGEGGGRPKEPFAEDELQWIEPLWRSLAIPTNDAARDMIRAEAAKRENRWHKITTRQINARLGASGRAMLKRKPARKGKTK